jgi:hypothetical protein
MVALVYQQCIVTSFNLYSYLKIRLFYLLLCKSVNEPHITTLDVDLMDTARFDSFFVY